MIENKQGLIAGMPFFYMFAKIAEITGMRAFLTEKKDFCCGNAIKNSAKEKNIFQNNSIVLPRELQRI